MEYAWTAATIENCTNSGDPRLLLATATNRRPDLTDPAESVEEFRKVADHEGASWGATWVHPFWGQYYALSFLGMARGYALAGETAKGKAAFAQFFGLWKDADPDVPLLKQAKAEYRKLP